MFKKVLILGGNGRFGKNAARAFVEAGWEVRLHDRTTDNLWDSAWGAKVIVNAWNPTYDRWEEEVPKLTRQVIEVASASGATVIIPGNVYVFGDEAPALFSEKTPHMARNHLGRIRVVMEEAYRKAGVRTIILRGGDYLDVVPSGNWFDKILTTRITRGRLRYPGVLNAVHAWAYLPDIARAAVELAEIRDQLEVFEDIPFAGYSLTGSEMAVALGKAMGRPVTAYRMSWLPIYLLQPFWPIARHLIEMRYLWNKPHQLDGARMAALLPGFRLTPLHEALYSAIEHQIDPDQPMARGGVGNCCESVAS